MAYTVVWNTKVVSIPISDLTLVSGAEYNLDLALFHKEVRRLEWDFAGGLFSEQIVDYTLPKTISGSTLSAVVEVINGYTFVFPVAADAVNLIGANTNLHELSITPPNGVSIRPNNSGGNTITLVNTGSGVTAQDVTDIAQAVENTLADDFTSVKDVNIVTINSAPIVGSGVEVDKWRGVE